MPTPNFYTHLNAIYSQGTANGAAAAAPGLTPHQWQIPGGAVVGAANGAADIQDPNFFIVGCNRADLNAAAVTAYDSGTTADAGRVGEVLAYKAALAHVAAYERAFHARYAGTVRRRVWAGARRTGHGDGTYGVFGAFSRFVESVRSAATSVTNDPTAPQD